MIIYKDVLKKLKTAGYSTATLSNEKHLAPSTVQAIRHNRPLSTKTIDTICRLAKCQPGDIMEYVEDTPADD